MWNRQGLSRYGLSLTLAFAVTYVTLAVFGYDPADPPTRSVAPANTTPTNPCGPIGASLAHHFLETLGWSIVVPLAGMASATLLLLRQRALSGWAWGSAGLPPLTLSAAAGLSRWFPDLEPSTPVGPGGYVGAAANLFLEDHFGKFGATLSIVACALLGLNLAWEFLVLWPVAEINSLLRWPSFWSTLAARLKPKFRIGRTPAPVQGRAAAAAVPIHRAATVPGPNVNPRPSVSPPAPNFSTATRVRSSQPALSAPALPAGMPVGNLPVPGARNSAPAASPPAKNANYLLPPFSILDPPAVAVQENEDRLQERAQVIEQTIAEFGHQVRVVQIDTGPVITQFEIELEAGLRVSRIVGLADDLARALAVQNVRIVAPIPGKSTVGIEVPNDRRGVVKINEIIERIGERIDRMRIPLFLGKDVKGNALAYDLADMPHLLIAGRTGTGKSVCLNAMIISILMTKRPDEVKLLLIDPKMVELSQFKQIPHLMHPVVTDMRKAEAILAWAVDKMEERYQLLSRAGVRHVTVYNQLGEDELRERIQPESDEHWKSIPRQMPFIVIVLIALGIAIINIHPPVVLFALFVVYGFSGYAVYVWRRMKGRPVSVIAISIDEPEEKGLHQ